MSEAVTNVSSFPQPLQRDHQFYLAHKSCAVKVYAYSLDSYVKSASAAQHKLPFLQRLGIARFFMPAAS